MNNIENNSGIGKIEENIYSKKCLVCNKNFMDKGKEPGICFGCALERDISIVEEKIKELDKHIYNYEKSNCKTAIYQELVKERNAISNVVNELKRIRKIDISSLIEDYETGQLIHRESTKDEMKK